MRIILDTRKSIEENAAKYFERAKKSKKKLEGAKKAIAIAEEKLTTIQVESLEQEKKQKEHVKKEKHDKEWYEKLRWFISSDGFLCIGGRDSTTNEIVVKKHCEKGDIVFHTDMAGSPFVVVKSQGKDIPTTTLEEAAQFCACFSRAWKNGFSYLEVFYVSPEQLSKEPNSGESLPKGAFVVRGNVKYQKPKIEICIGKEQSGRLMVASEKAILSRCEKGYMILQGNEKSSDIAKRLSKLIDADVDEIVALLPNGGVKLGKEIKTREVRHDKD